ncbi:PREDICTED: P-selectin glycoprotein ligand 1 isoform X2 [Gavialis gangeticus]|uniref:P-selectin glycoprotein ligand 1 isoform X1 n=1 Tax=Gavialis gangeticus TaxID=94835 RepID=UPI00092EA93F|nr:PREDICTED: P-selectin glycoprotein ligand 1 isoform X1 [Gavialis gangeticus]XP_019362749.1 PREDICTED: P-selectin glycoprotein ligand 1 isoform X2 [Gavialis gangeticus]
MEPRSRLKKHKNKCFNLLLLGYMALMGISVLLGLSSLEAGDYRLADRLSNDREDRFPAGGRSPPARQAQWVWRAAGERDGHLPSLLRRKREASGKLSGPIAKATASTTPLKMAFSTTAGSPSTEADGPAPELLKCPHCDSATKASSVTGPQKVSIGGTDVVRTGPPVTSTVAPALRTSTHGPEEAETTLSASTASQANGSAAVLGESKGQKETASALPPTPRTSTSTISMETPVDDVDTTEPSDLVTEATLSTGTASQANGSAAALGEKKSKKETSTLPPSSWANVSTEAPVDDADTTEPLRLSTEGKPSSSHPTFRAGGFGTTQTALEKSRSPTEDLMGKCLLGILILAFVAATFIICATVLATMLWRQKHAYQRLRRSNTEMVCISSLLPDGEPGANGGRPVSVRRMRRFPDTGSDTEGDNLTLSSFLPDH